MNMQESRAERADCAIHEMNRQIQSYRMEIYHTNQGYATSRREPAWLHAELKKKKEKELINLLALRLFMKWKN